MSEAAKGLIDLHIHGAFGVDVLTASAADLDRLALGLSARGVSGFLPTLVPQPLGETAATVARLSSWMRSRRAGDGRGAMPLGIHFEGPFVSAARCFLHYRAGCDHNILDFEAQESVALQTFARGKAKSEWMGEYYQSARMIFNDRLDAGLSIFFMVIVAVVIVASAREWWLVAAKRKAPRVHEAPFVQTAFDLTP